VEKIQWGQSFSVGVARLDEQHRRLIDMINMLAEHPEADVRSETVSEILNRMTRYASEHFKTEEELLEMHGYPELPSHREMHEAFIAETAEFCHKTTLKIGSIPAEIFDYLKGWLTQHILGVDMKYSAFLRGKAAR